MNVDVEKELTDGDGVWTIQSTEKTQSILKLLSKEWDQKKNVNAFLFSKYIELYPVFVEPTVKRGRYNEEKYVLKKSLLDRFVNKVMSKNASNAGKKKKAYKLTYDVLSEKSMKMGVNVTDLLILLLVKAVPNQTVRKLRFGSGHVTRAVTFTIMKKISWFLKAFASVFKTRRKSFRELFLSEINMILTDDLKSKVLTLKRECIANAANANIQ